MRLLASRAIFKTWPCVEAAFIRFAWVESQVASNLSRFGSPTRSRVTSSA